MNRSYDALAAHCRGQAEKYVWKLEGPRVSATWAALLPWHRRWSMRPGADVNHNEIARKIAFEAEQKAPESGIADMKGSTYRVDSHSSER